MLNRLKTGFLAAGGVVLCGAIAWAATPAASPPPAPAPKPAQVIRNAEGIVYVAPNPKAFVPAKTIEGWVAHFDDKAIRAHAYQIWGALSALTNQYYSVKAKNGQLIKSRLATFDTWFDEYEVFHTSPGGVPDTAAAHHLHAPRQGTGGGAGGTEVISFNKYSLEFRDYVNANHYYGEQTLIDLNNKFDKACTPLAQRVANTDFPDNAVMLKPTYYIVKRDRPTPMQYWKGPNLTVDGTTYPAVPTMPTWEQIVVVDPTGKAKPGDTYKIKVLSPAKGYETRTMKADAIVGLKNFYWFPLSADDIAYIKGGNVFTINGVAPTDMEPGDIALLVGMHVTTNEFGPWTWQTFFWRPKPVADAGPFVKAPFNNYDTAQTYYMVGADGKPRIGFNPYLETPIIGPTFMDQSMRGADSNCMSCHHAAAFPTLNNDPSFANMLDGSYYSKGQVTGTEQWFRNRTKTVFMWGEVMQNQGVGLPLSSAPPACPSTP
jgi:hypothetical protein